MQRKLAALLAVLCAVAIGVIATLPESRRSIIDTRGALHPYVHVVAFTLLAWLSAWSTRSTGVRVGLCALVALLGCVTEITEWQMYGNPLELPDVVLDAIGAVAGTGVGALTMPRERLRRRRSTGRD